MIKYQILWESILRQNSDGSITAIPKDQNNTDYQEYLQWINEGNEPEIINPQ